MRKLNVMLFRDLLRLKKQMIAIIIIIFIGITLFSSCVMAYRNLEAFKSDFYRDNNFLDSYLMSESVSDETVKNIKGIKGIREVESRNEIDGTIILEDDKSAIGKFLFYNQEPEINQLRFVEGGYINNQNSCLVSKNFAEFHQLKTGDSINLKFIEIEKTFTISGIVESPEFIITIKSRDYIMPSIEDYGIIYLDNQVLKNEFGNELLLYNQVHLTYESGIKTKQIKNDIKSVFGDKYFYMVDRNDQISEVMAREDIGMISEIAYTFPVMFLFSASLVIIVMQKKLVETQRTTIGVLKAMGYQNQRLIFHYLKQGLMLGGGASILSIIPAYYLSCYITEIYCDLVYIPLSEYRFDWIVIIVAILISCIISVIASFMGVKSILNISAAEAIRPANVSVKQFNPLKRIVKRLNFSNTITYRNLCRNLMRSMFVVICSCIAFVLFSAPIYLNQSVSIAEKSQYEDIQNYEYKVVFNEMTDISSINQIFLDKGITLDDADIALETQVDIFNNNSSKKIKLIGVTSNYKLFDGYKKLTINENKILLPLRIKNELNTAKAESIGIEFLMSNIDNKEYYISDYFTQYISFSGYIDRTVLQKDLGLPNVANVVYIKDNIFNSTIKNSIEKSELVQRIDSIEQESKDYNTLLNLVNIFILIMIIFGILMGGASIYNATMINILDRKTEWSTMKVIGHSDYRISEIMAKEVLICYLISLPVSFLLSSIVNYVLGIMMSNEFYTSPYSMSLSIYLWPTLLVLIISLISIFVYKKNISKIKAVEITRTKD